MGTSTKTQTIARAWVLEFGRDCDGVSTRGQIIACASLQAAEIAHNVADEWSDGNYYKTVEKWSDVVDYCGDYQLDTDDYTYTN